MLEFLKRRLSSEKGAMDTILVTLLLVVIGIAAVVGLSTWVTNSSDALQKTAKADLVKAVDGTDVNTSSLASDE